MLQGFIQILCAFYWLYAALYGNAVDWHVATWTLSVVMAIFGIGHIVKAYTEEL